MDRKDILAENLERVIQRMEKARLESDPHQIVKLVAVGKYADIDSIEGLYELGQRAFGENRVQQLYERKEKLSNLPIEWHMIGRLQKNKINKLIDCDPFLLHSLDSMELAESLDKRLIARGKKMRALLQINSAREDSKGGFDPDEAESAYREINERFEHIELKGVMTIGAHTTDEKKIVESFETTRKIFDSLHDCGAEICSMGMSSDFELAIKCGSNMLRLGSILFSENR